MRIPLLLLTLTLATIGCRKVVTTTSSPAVTTPDTLIAGMVIRTAGTWSAHTKTTTNKLAVTVSPSSVSWEVTKEEKLPGGGSGGASGSSGLSLPSPTAPWFIFVESPQRLWFFNGTSDLNYNLSDHGGSRGGPAISAGKLLPTDEKVPTDLILLLPPDLQKQFPPIPPKTDRPSF
ncbi:hypothetical protein [Luteolibacter soli]|uniref:Uncharacterized protein n=1 Tax=Luteolibacter soli TaxID=3135280 RepID=A0ABU9AQ76_9BACT